MNISKELDLAIKVAETQTTDGAYGKYNTYMTKEEWEAFKSAMLPSALEEYGAGGGDELSEKNGRPPKMACYGSSSRMIYKLSCHKDGFHYEKKLATTVGGTANLDGFLEEESRYVFVEAKCHEPYSAKSATVSKAYKKLYAYINARMDGNVEIEMKASKCGRYLEVEYSSGGEKLERFEMKQMICHLLGIATGILKGELKQKQIDFIYLLYDPTHLNLDPDIKAEVNAIYKRTCYECNLIDFTALLRVILSFLKKEKYSEALSDEKLDALLCKFTFSLASQDLYPILIQ